MKSRILVILIVCIFTPFVALNIWDQSTSSLAQSQPNNCVNTTQVFLPIVKPNNLAFIDQPWEQEPNDYYQDATGALRPDVDYYGYPDDQWDFFSFYMQTSGQISIDLKKHVGKGVQLLLYYDHESPETLVENDTSEPFSITRNRDEIGWYYVAIYTESGYTDAIPYTLRVNYPVLTPQPTPTISTLTPTPTCTPTSTPTTSPASCTSSHLGAGKPITVTMSSGCYYHFNVACEGCRMNEENNYVLHYSGGTVNVTVPEGSVWQYNREPESGEVCNPPDGVLDHWPTSLPPFLSLAGVQQLFPCEQPPTATPTNTPMSATCLAPDEARSWCEGAACTSERFEQLQEDNGVINPCGVKLKMGDPVAFNIPDGVSADVWDCANVSNVKGPVRLPQVCEASFRRSATNTPTPTPSPSPTNCNATPHTGLDQGNHTFNGVAHIAELWRANGQTPWGDKSVTAAVMGDLHIIEAGGSVWTYPEGCEEIAKREAAESAIRTGSTLITEAEMRAAGLIK